MKAKRFIAPALLAVLVLSCPTIMVFAQEKKDAKQEKVFIPKEVKAVLQEGLASRQGRQDIPVSVGRHFFLPAQENLYGVFYVKLKNSDLGFAPAVQPPAKPAAQPVDQPPATPPLQANFNIFVQFNKVDPAKGLQPFREIYMPTSLQEDPASYDPNKENLYSLGYPLPAGNYVLALAVTSLDLKKIGAAYFEFALPDPRSFVETLGSTPMLFTKKIDQTDAPETKTLLHKDFFAYSILKVYANLENTFAVGENVDLFLYIFGCQPNANDPQKFTLETNFEVKKFDEAKKAEETVIRWATQNYEAPLVIQTLPLKQTLVIKDDKGERKETRDLSAGKYTLILKMTDKNSGRLLAQTTEFEVK